MIVEPFGLAHHRIETIAIKIDRIDLVAVALQPPDRHAEQARIET
jgi:hypothetical protein